MYISENNNSNILVQHKITTWKNIVFVQEINLISILSIKMGDKLSFFL